MERTPLTAWYFGSQGGEFQRSSTGSVELSFRNPDPNPKKEDIGDTARLDLDVLDSGMLEIRDLTTLGILADDAGQDPLLDWSDEEAVPTSLTLTVPEQHLVASAEGFGTSNRARAQLADQYGYGVGRGEIIRFTSTDPSVAPNNINRHTNVRGVATFDYRRDSDSGATETITAQSGDLEATAHQYWAAPIPPTPPPPAM